MGSHPHLRVCKELAKALGILRYNTELPSEKFVQRVGGSTETRGSGPPFNTVLSGQRGSICKQAPMLSAATLKASGQGQRVKAPTSHGHPQTHEGP